MLLLCYCVSDGTPYLDTSSRCYILGIVLNIHLTWQHEQLCLQCIHKPPRSWREETPRQPHLLSAYCIWIKSFYGVGGIARGREHDSSNRTASIHIAIFSPRYAESTWCLNELVLMLESRSTIIPVFYIRNLGGGQQLFRFSIMSILRNLGGERAQMECSELGWRKRAGGCLLKPWTSYGVSSCVRGTKMEWLPHVKNGGRLFSLSHK